MATRTIKRIQCIYTGSQTRKANMESIVTFIDIFIKEKIFHSLTDLNLIVSFRDRAYRTLQEKLKSNSTEEKLNEIIQQRKPKSKINCANFFFFFFISILRKLNFPFHDRADKRFLVNHQPLHLYTSISDSNFYKFSSGDRARTTNNLLFNIFPYQ